MGPREGVIIPQSDKEKLQLHANNSDFHKTADGWWLETTLILNGQPAKQLSTHFEEKRKKC